MKHKLVSIAYIPGDNPQWFVEFRRPRKKQIYSFFTPCHWSPLLDEFDMLALADDLITAYFNVR